MIEKMQKDSIGISMEQMQERFGDTVLTRAHIARFLMEHGYVAQMSEAFDRYLSPGCPYYIEREKVTPQMAVSLIASIGGIPVLAHPMLYHPSDAQLKDLIHTLKPCGLIGIETVYSTYSEEETAYIQDLASDTGLCQSGGSDFHGSNKPAISLGTGRGNLKISYDILTNLREARKK